MHDRHLTCKNINLRLLGTENQPYRRQQFKPILFVFSLHYIRLYIYSMRLKAAITRKNFLTAYNQMHRRTVKKKYFLAKYLY